MSTIPSSPTICPDCGGRIPADAPRGICVVCMTGLLFPENGEGEEWEDDMPPPSPPGMRFGAWRLLEQAGEGAFGLVYEAAQDRPIRRKAALKVLKPGLDSREIMARFAMEREALAVLDHPGIARVLDAGTEEGRPWIASEWVEDASPVTAYARDHALSISARVLLFAEICEAVSHAHQRGIIHRDLKPSNLLVSREGRPKVIDFGIARATEHVLARSTLVTLAGQVLGTPAYMSPEQAAGRGTEADVRSDIYSLGAVLYEMLTGRTPFGTGDGGEATGSLTEVLRRVREEEPPRPSLRDGRLRGGLEWILLKALEKDPARRYETAAAMGRDLRNWVEGGTLLAAPPGRAQRLRTFLRRHRTAALGALAVFAALLAGLAGTTWMYHRARSGEADALASGARAEAGEALARRNASLGDHRTAQAFFDQEQAVTGVMHLARALRTDPTNTAAAARLMAELAWTDFPEPAWPPLLCPEFIRRAEFSPDGSRLAVFCSEHNGGFAPGVVLLLNAADGAPVSAALPTGLHDFAFSPDSRLIALSQADGDVSFRLAADGSDAGLPVLRHPRPVRGVSWGGMKRLATLEDANEDSTGRLWSLEDPLRPAVMAEIPKIQALSYPAWAADDSLVAWLPMDGTVTVRRAADGQEVSRWKTPGEGRLAFVRDKRLAVQTLGGDLRLYDSISGQPVGEGTRDSAAPYAILPAPDGGSLLSVGLDGLATLRDGLSLTPQHAIPGRWWAGSFARHGSLLALGSEAGEHLMLYDMNRLQPARATLIVPGMAAAVALSPDGSLLAAGGRQRRLTVYEVRPRAARPQVLALGRLPWQAAWSEDGRGLFVLREDGITEEWDLLSKSVRPARLVGNWDSEGLPAVAPRLTRGFRGGRSLALGSAGPGVIPIKYRAGLNPASLTSSAVSPDGAWLALGVAGDGLRLVSLSPSADGAPVSSPFTSTPRALAFSADGRRLAVGMEDGIVMLVDSASLRQIEIWRPHLVPVNVLAVLPDGRVASGAEDGGVALSPGDRIPPEEPGAVSQLEVTPDGRYFVTGSKANMARIHDAATGRPVSPPLRHRSVVAEESGVTARISPDGSLLATAGSHDGAVHLWRIPSGEACGLLQHPGLVVDHVFDPAGDRLISLSAARSPRAVHVWDLATGLPLMPSRPLTDQAPGLFLTVSPDAARVAVFSQHGVCSVFDLPPHLSAAPPWLADAAEERIGWRFDASGQITARQKSRAAIPVPASGREVSVWEQWLAAPAATRTMSPHSVQDRVAYLAVLDGLGLPETYAEYNQLAPVEGGMAALRALRLLDSGKAEDRPRAAQLAAEALALAPPHSALAGVAARVLGETGTTSASFSRLALRCRQRPQKADNWRNLSLWLTRWWRGGEEFEIPNPRRWRGRGKSP